jgi:methionyl-tRNA formyltransferase
MKRKNKTIHLFGGGTLLVEAVKICLKKKLPVVVRTSTRLAKPASNWVKEMRNLKTNIFIGNSLSKILKKGPKVQMGDIGISFGAPWIFKNFWVNQWNDNLYNCHNRPLPQHRGAGGASWIILMGELKGASSIHRIKLGVDNGPLVYQKDYIYPKNLKFPSQFDQFDEKKGKKFLLQNLPKILSGKNPQKEQNSELASYWPRLNTPIHGWINWNWPAKSIIAFVNAFGPPYEGAKTFFKKNKIFIYKIKLQKNAVRFHPFQTGLVFRKEKNKSFWIAHPEGQLHIIKWASSGADIPKLGDRLFTPNKILERALNTRVQYLPNGTLVKYSFL